MNTFLFLLRNFGLMDFSLATKVGQRSTRLVELGFFTTKVFCRMVASDEAMATDRSLQFSMSSLQKQFKKKINKNLKKILKKFKKFKKNLKN